MKTIFAVATIALAATSAVAQDVKTRDDLTVQQVMSIASGLRQLNKYDTVDKEGKATSAYYKFSSDLRYLIANDLDIATRVETIFQSANNSLVLSMSNGGSKVSDEKVGEYTVASQKLIEAPCRCSLYKIKLSDLKLDENPVTSGVLSLIFPIIEK